MPPRALILREGKAPVRDRLLTMLFLAGLLHGLVILGVTFNSAIGAAGGAPSLDVLLVSEEVPETERNDSATYLAQRTQLGSGNRADRVAPRNQAAALATPKQEGAEDGAARARESHRAGSPDERVLATTAFHAEIRYLADYGNAGSSASRPLLLTEQSPENSGPEEEAGPAQLRGPKRDELWITPDTRASTLAPYLDAWRRKVERLGTPYYRKAAGSAGASGNPVLEVGIDADGKLDRAVIRRSSGNPELDAAALATLKLASPFDPFPADLARRYRVVRFAYEWRWALNPR